MPIKGGSGGKFNASTSNTSSKKGGKGGKFNSSTSNTSPEDVTSKFREDFYKNNSIDTVNYFNPFHFQSKEEPLVKGLPIIFITTPRLNLKKTNIDKLGFFKYMSDVEPNLLSLLNFGGDGGVTTFGTGSPFIKILTNNFREIQLTGVTSRTKEYNETFYGFKQLFPTAIIDSITANEISVTYFEDKNLDIIKLHKVWTDYIEYCRRGVIKPSQHAITGRYLDFTSSIYYFLLDFDFETIQYYAKYTGCAPLNVPYDVLSSSMDGGSREVVSLGINYVYSYKEDMNPDILTDFNIVSSSASKLTTEDYVDKILYSSNVSNVDIEGDLYTDKDYSKIQSVAVSLEAYGDSPDKKRYKLKFLENKPPESLTYMENSISSAFDNMNKLNDNISEMATLQKRKRILETKIILGTSNKVSEPDISDLKELIEIRERMDYLNNSINM